MTWEGADRTEDSYSGSRAGGRERDASFTRFINCSRIRTNDSSFLYRSTGPVLPEGRHAMRGDVCERVSVCYRVLKPGGGGERIGVHVEARKEGKTLFFDYGFR